MSMAAADNAIRNGQHAQSLSQCHPPPLMVNRAEVLRNGTISGHYICPICKFRSQDKHCFHYGGVSCYSCRAFFRRAHQLTKVPDFRCKKEGRCEVTVKTRRKCQKCRYDLCIRAGMDPELVLNEDQKKVRFRNYLKKKKQKGVEPEQPGAANSSDSVTSTIQDIPFVSSTSQAASKRPDMAEPESSSPKYMKLEPDTNSNSASSSDSTAYQQDQPSPDSSEPMESSNGFGYEGMKGSYGASFLFNSDEAEEERSPSNSSHEQVAREPQVNAIRPVRSVPSADYYLQPAAYLNKRDLVSSVCRSFSTCLSSLDVSPQFIAAIQRFHAEPMATACGAALAVHVKKRELNKELFAAHIFKIANQFKQFALLQASFQELSMSDQMCQLSKNTALLIHYIIARYVTACSGEEQLRWFLDVNVPQNLSADIAEPQKIDFDMFNDNIGIFKAADPALNVYRSLCQKVGSVELSPASTGLLANLALFYQDPAAQLQNPTKVQSSFIEALDLFKFSQEEEVNVASLLSLLASLSQMNEVFNENVDWSPSFKLSQSDLPHLNLILPYTAEEEQWLNDKLLIFRKAFGEVLPTDRHISQWFQFTCGSALPKEFVSSGIQIFMERIWRVAMAYPEFQELPVRSQNSLWARNRLACLALCVMRIDLCKSGVEQLRYGMGNYLNEEWLFELKKVGFRSADSSRVPYVGMVDYNRTANLLSTMELAGYFKLLKHVSQVVKDDASFELALLTLLFSGESDPSSGVAQIHRNFLSLLQRRFACYSELPRILPSAQMTVATAYPMHVQRLLPAEAQAVVQNLPRIELTASSCMQITKEISRIGFIIRRMESL